MPISFSQFKRKVLKMQKGKKRTFTLNRDVPILDLLKLARSLLAKQRRVFNFRTKGRERWIKARRIS